METIRTFQTGNNQEGKYYSLPALSQQGYPGISRMPVSLRIVLEAVLRHCDGIKVRPEDIANLANWSAKNPGDYEIPFVVSRIVLQDFTGVPLLVDLAAMRTAVSQMGKDAFSIEPLVPVDLVIDHSVQIDASGTASALAWNLEKEFQRNTERYEFLKWGQQAFETFSVIPPSVGIVHQVNLEYLTPGVQSKGDVYFPDTLVGTDSHTTMINGLGVVAWGVGGIEAEAGMLGQPVTFLVPEVIGVHLNGELQAGVTATDLALYVTEILRKKGVVGKFVEFFGPGASSLSLPDRATVANMAPEYGATMGFFPLDEECSAYLRATGRSEEAIKTYENYFKAQELWGMPQAGDIDYSDIVEIRLDEVSAAVAGPKRPQDRIVLTDLKSRFTELLTQPVSEGGYGKSQEDAARTVTLTLPTAAGCAEAPELEPDFTPHQETLHNGSVLIASITSCTNTSNPGVMLAAGLLAQKAVAKGLSVPAYVKTSLAPGSRVVTDYLQAAGLEDSLDKLGFETVAYGCATCIGNSGPLSPAIEKALTEGSLIGTAVLSGNRNFEARVHAAIKGNFLMSPPLVVAFALAGRVDIDMATEALGQDKDGNNVYLRDIWPSRDEINAALASALNPKDFKSRYANAANMTTQWQNVPCPTGDLYPWNDDSTYIQNPPFFAHYTGQKNSIHNLENARALGIFGDSVTTDHISPAGAIRETGPAGRYLKEKGVERADFNSFGSRRGNDRIMTRGTFANVRIKNLMVEGVEGGYTLYFGNEDIPAPDKDIQSTTGKPAFIYDAAQAYQKEKTPLIIIGGEDYGMGSSRDWAAKGTNILGVQAVIVKSFERIHRSNLIGMGVLPLTFINKEDYDKVKNLKDARFSLTGLNDQISPRQEVSLDVIPATGETFSLPVQLRLDTPMEIEYYRAGGILPYVLTQILAQQS